MPSQDTLDSSNELGPREEALSVSQAMDVAKRALGAYTITVKGEVSELSDKPGYKAVYFTITDKKSAMPCLMWKSEYEASEVRLRLGLVVEVSGTFTVYAAKGRMNFNARTLRPAGIGDLRQQVAELARKLDREGLMSVSRKRPLPSFPDKVAIVTSPRGKAVHDCLRTLRRRWPLSEVYVCGVTVEGTNAPLELIRGLEVAATSGASVILLVRGGGSYEDLMPFNDERLARKVASCPIPVVTGIGHEPDNSICDMVADLRCSTPTAAAEAVVPMKSEMIASIDSSSRRLARSLRQTVLAMRGRHERIASQPLFRNPETLLQDRMLSVDLAEERLSRAIPGALAQDRRRFETMVEKLTGTGKVLVNRFDHDLATRASRLEDLSPLSILSRGYAITYGSDGHTVIDSVRKASAGEDISIRVQDGHIEATIRNTFPKE